MTRRVQDSPTSWTERQFISLADTMSRRTHRNRIHFGEGRKIHLRIAKPRVFKWMGVSWHISNNCKNLLKTHDVIEMRVGEKDRLNCNAVNANCIQEWTWIIACIDDPSRTNCIGLDPDQPAICLPCAQGETFDSELCHGENIDANLPFMLKRRIEEVDPVAIDLPGTQGVSMRLMVGRKDGAPNFSMRHYTVAPGGNTPRHQHDYEHEVIITGGQARVEYDGELHSCHAGDILMINPNRMHQFVNDGKEDLTFICLVPVSFDCGKPTPGS